MQCPQCGELVSPGAAYCGNCGAALIGTVIQQPLVESPPIPGQPPIINTSPTIPAPVATVAATPSVPAIMSAASITAPVQQPLSTTVPPIQPALASIAVDAPSVVPIAPPSPPAYAVTDPNQSKVEGKAMAALILSILAVPGSIVPFIGWILACSSIVIATSVRSRLPHKFMGNLAISFAAFAIVLSAAVFAFNIKEFNKKADQNSSNGNVAKSDADGISAGNVSGKSLETPCYALDTPGMVQVDTVIDSCQAQAYSGPTLSVSTNALNIESVSQSKINATNLDMAGKEVANNYLRSSIPEFVLTSQKLGTFADSPAYIIEGKGGSSVTIELALVVHATAHGENIFVVAHAINDSQADLSQFESSWVWK